MLRFFQEYANPVQPVGLNVTKRSYETNAAVTYAIQTSNGISMHSNPWCQLSGPIVQLPGTQQFLLPPMLPALCQSANLSGYTTNHLAYNPICQKLAHNAYAQHGGYTVTVQVKPVCWPATAAKKQMIGVCSFAKFFLSCLAEYCHRVSVRLLMICPSQLMLLNSRVFSMNGFCLIGWSLQMVFT